MIKHHTTPLRRQRSHVRIVSGAPIFSTVWSFSALFRFWAGKHWVSSSTSSLETYATAIVGIRCKDGVVIGADSSATFGDGGGNRFIEQSTRRKIEIIGENVIVAGTGAVGHMQRFTAVTQKLWSDKAFAGKSETEIGKM